MLLRSLDVNVFCGQGCWKELDGLEHRCSKTTLDIYLALKMMHMHDFN